MNTIWQPANLYTRLVPRAVRLFLVAALIVVPAAASQPQPVGADDCLAAIVVTNNSDSGAGSLRQAAADICDGGTITFDSGLSSATITMLSVMELLYFYTGLTIDGSELSTPVTISGGDTHGLIHVGGGSIVALDGLKFANGHRDYGGAISLEQSSTLTVTDCIFEDNWATMNGGAIFSGGTLIVTGSTLQGNTAEGKGGGIHSTVGSLTITDSILQQNGSSSEGAGIYSNAASLTVTRVTFFDNQTNMAPGGGIYFHDNYPYDKVLTVTDSTFDSNLATRGGGIAIPYGYATVTNSTFTGNIASDQGGGIGGGENDMTVVNSTFSGNSADMGGGIYNLSTLNLINSTLSGNIALSSGGGGGIDNNGEMNFVNTIIANSTNMDCLSPAAYSITFNLNNLVEDGSCSEEGVNFLSGDDPLLGALADNGGPTETMALLSGSPALDAGDYTTCMDPPVNGLDQRGEDRSSVDSYCDIGAFEYTGNIWTIFLPLVNR